MTQSVYYLGTICSKCASKNTQHKMFVKESPARSTSEIVHVCVIEYSSLAVVTVFNQSEVNVLDQAFKIGHVFLSCRYSILLLLSHDRQLFW